jgi:hypothetical protein
MVLYNSNMKTVTLTDPNQALLAGAWCNDNIGNGNWDMSMRNFFGPNTRYDFTFSQPEYATVFALKWL